MFFYDYFDKARFIYFYEKFMLVAGAAGHLMFIVQGCNILQKGSAYGVSLPAFIITSLSLFCWLVYGLVKSDKVLVFVNSFGLAANIFCIATILAYQ